MNISANKRYLDYSDKVLSYYLKDISNKSNLITKKRETELGKMILENKNKPKAVNELVTSNLKFAIKVAQQYQFNGLSLPDLINEANIGLIKAAERFDYRKGIRFISYAVWWVKESILSSLCNNSRLIKLPISRIKKINKEKKIIEKILLDGGVISDKPLEKELPIISLSIDYSDGYSKMLFEIENDDFDIIERKNVESIEKDFIDISLNYLEEREKNILEMYFGLGEYDEHTLELIGKKLNITAERVRQLKEKAIRKIRTTLTNKNVR